MCLYTWYKTKFLLQVYVRISSLWNVRRLLLLFFLCSFRYSLFLSLCLSSVGSILVLIRDRTMSMRHNITSTVSCYHLVYCSCSEQRVVYNVEHVTNSTHWEHRLLSYGIETNRTEQMSNDAIFRKNKIVKIKEEGSMIVHVKSRWNRIHFTCSAFDTSNVSPYLKRVHMCCCLFYLVGNCCDDHIIYFTIKLN